MAKSPTPIPAPPVKIHRGAPGSAPTRQRRRRKKVNPFVLFLCGLARRLYFGIKTAFKFLLFVPVLVFMVAFSYNVDRSGLFQGALAPRRIVDLMLQGYDVTNFEQMDEREVVQLFAQDVPETPEAIGIGSSRVLQFNRENTGVESFFNMGVTGADVRDNMTSYYKMVTYGKAPKVLLWSIDPWVFYGSEAAFDARADADLYNEFLTKVLNVPTDYEEPGVLRRTIRRGTGDIAAGPAMTPEECRAAVYASAGVGEFNLNSPKQLGEVLFDKLGLPAPQKKSQSGYSTTAEVLEGLAPYHPMIEPLLRYRRMAKLQSTYVEGLTKLRGSDGRVHTTFDQTATVTGRISSLEPNLQNIPIRTEEGREIRAAGRGLQPDRAARAGPYERRFRHVRRIPARPGHSHPHGRGDSRRAHGPGHP